MPATYEIMDPKTVGRDRELVLGKLSGRHAFLSRILELGYSLPEEKINEAFRLFKDTAERKKEIKDEGLRVIIRDVLANKK